MPAVNERVAYRSCAGEEWAATIAAVHPDGKVDIVLDIPNRDPSAPPFALRAIRWYDDRGEPLPGARPKAEAIGQQTEGAGYPTGHQGLKRTTDHLWPDTRPWRYRFCMRVRPNPPERRNIFHGQ